MLSRARLACNGLNYRWPQPARARNNERNEVAAVDRVESARDFGNLAIKEFYIYIYILGDYKVDVKICVIYTGVCLCIRNDYTSSSSISNISTRARAANNTA